MAPPKRRGLGRGLGALIPTDVSELTSEAPSAPVAAPAVAVIEKPAVPVQVDVSRETAPAAPAPVEEEAPDLSPVPGAKFRVVPLDSIVVNPKQPREVFDEEALEELKASIREVGLLQPIVVRPYIQETEEGTLSRYELIMGERRLRASRSLDLESIPAIIRETRDEDMLRDALLENIHRAQLNPLEEGAAYQQLLEEFGVTQEELSRRIGRSRPQISNTIRLLNLPGPVQRRVAAGVLSAGHARALLALPTAEAQEALAKRIVAEGLSVRTTEELVQQADVSRETEGGSSRARRAKPSAPGVEDLANRLADHFETRVKVNLGQRKGRITIEFATVSDLERIVDMMRLEQAGSE